MANVFSIRKKLNSRRTFESSVDDLREVWENQGDTLIFPTQRDAGDEIVDLFTTHNKVAVTMTAPCQWGKTGTALHVIEKLATFADVEKLIPYQHIYIITGLSSIDWKEQTKKRIPECLHDKILHLPEINKVIPRNMHKCRDALFVIDECHIANGIDQTISDAFKKCEILTLEYMKENNIKILQVSATPDNSLQGILDWGDDHELYVPCIPDTYVSFEKLFDWNRVYPKLDLRDEEQLSKFFTHVIEEFNVPKYHILRVNTRHDIHDSIKQHAETHNIKILYHDCSDRAVNNLNDDLLVKPPDVHTIIIIKQMLKAAQTLNDKNIGIVHESVANCKNYSTEVQGLCGRLCGHGKQMGHQGPLLFCDVTILKNYIKLFNENFDYKTTKWSSDRLKSNGYGRVDYFKSWANGNVLCGIAPASRQPLKNKDYTYKIHRIPVKDFPSRVSPQEVLEEVKKFLDIKTKLKFDESNCDENGYYMCSTTGGKRVFTECELKHVFDNFSPHSNLGVNLKDTNYIIRSGTKLQRMYVCYENTTSADSVKYPIIYVRIFIAINDCDFSETAH